MTDETNTDEEPSIEEILSSIRDIISDEDEDGEQPAAETTVAEEASAPEKNDDTPAVAESTPTPSDTGDSDDDVLDLANFEQEQDDINIDEEIAQEVETEDSNEEGDDPLAGINLDHPEDDLDITDVPATDDGLTDILEEENIIEESVDEVVEEDIQDQTPEISEPDTEQEEDDALVDKIAETATVGAMAKLAENIAISNNTQGTTLEDIVRELLRPMIKTWLDDNLPNTIERLVSKELERLAEKAIRK